MNYVMNNNDSIPIEDFIKGILDGLEFVPIEIDEKRVIVVHYDIERISQNDIRNIAQVIGSLGEKSLLNCPVYLIPGCAKLDIMDFFTFAVSLPPEQRRLLAEAITAVENGEKLSVQ